MVGMQAEGEWQGGRSVAAMRHEHALEVARAFAEIIRDEPVARELWVTVDTEEPGIYLWLVTDPIDMEAEGRVLDPLVDRLEERFPREYILVLPRHTRNTTGDPHGSPRPDAVQIPLRAG